MHASAHQAIASVQAFVVAGAFAIASFERGGRD
jgi:hypothetical protein